MRLVLREEQKKALRLGNELSRYPSHVLRATVTALAGQGRRPHMQCCGQSAQVLEIGARVSALPVPDQRDGNLAAVGEFGD